MSTETIDHTTLARLVEAGAVRAAHVTGQIGGWGVTIQYGTNERPLAASRSRQVRIFKKLETVASYLKNIGIKNFDVDVENFDSTTIKTYSRPDRAEAMKHAHEAADHDKWFRRQVKDGLAEADDPLTEWVPHEVAKQDMAQQRAALRARIEGKAK
ncbi:MAG: hypothetical protein K2P57_00310 [Burkholderiales bacterium]|nr:hypothetical protein [Burkholderiales bacterium]